LTVVVVAGSVVEVLAGIDVVVVAKEVEVVESAGVDVVTGSEICPEHAETAIRATAQARRRMGRR
jgi:hypothetical protein